MECGKSKFLSWIMCDAGEVLKALLETYYSSNASSPAQYQELNAIMLKVFGQTQDKNAALILKAAGVTTPSAAISVLQKAGYSLDAIVRALKDIYNVNAVQATDLLMKSGLFQQADIALQVQAVFGGDFVLIFIQYWQGMGGNIYSVYLALADRLGITDPIIRINYLKQAGYADSDIWEMVSDHDRDNLLQVIAGIYGLKDPVSAGGQLKQLKQQAPSMYFGMNDMVSQIPKVFPGTDTVTTVKALLAAGFPVYSSGGEDIWGLLRSNNENGQHDDALVAMLGSAGPDCLSLNPWDAVELIHGMGYNLTDATAWLLKDKYTMDAFFPDLVQYYGSYRNVGYGVWDSKAMPVLKTLYSLKDSSGRHVYTLQDLAQGDLAYYRSSCTDIINYYDVFSDLLANGISEDNAVEVMLTLGGGGELMSGLVSILEEDAPDPYHRASEKHIAGIIMAAWVNIVSAYAEPDPAHPVPTSPLITEGIINPSILNPDGTSQKINLTFGDIVYGLIDNGPNASQHNAIAWFSWDEVYEALCAIDGPYLSALGLDLRTDIGALQLLKAAGMPADDAISIEEAEGVGLSGLDLFTTFIGFDSPWVDAVTNLMAAGYSATDSLNALMRNQTYRMVLGASFLTSVLTNSTFLKGLGAAEIVTKGITVYNMCVKLGWAIDKTIVADYKSAGINYGLFGVSAAGLVYSAL